MTQSVDSPYQPAFAVTPHIADVTGCAVGWWTDPPGVLLQLTVATRGTTEMAEWLVGPVFDRLVERFPDSRELRVILDMKQMTGRSATARALLMQRAESLRARIAHVVLLPSTLLGPTYLKVVEAAVLLLRPTGLRIDIEHALDRVIEQHGVRPAAASALESGPDLFSDPRSVRRGQVGDLSRT